MAIQFKRGSGHSSSTVLADGQPYYDKTNGFLYIGDGSTAINALTPVAGKYYQVISLSASSTYIASMQFTTFTVYDSTSSFGTTASAGNFYYDHLDEGGYMSGFFLNIHLAYWHVSSTTQMTYGGTTPTPAPYTGTLGSLSSYVSFICAYKAAG